MHQQAWDRLKLELIERAEWAVDAHYRMAAKDTLRLIVKLEQELKE